jgi:hypothetical protein
VSLALALKIMKLGNEENNITIEILELSKNDRSAIESVRLSAWLKLGDFSGGYEQIWVETEEIEGFLAALTVLEETRTGEACLFSLSPEEFEFRISPINFRGHLQADVKLNVWNSFENRSAEIVTLTGGFEFDPGLFSQFVNSFRYNIKQKS